MKIPNQVKAWCRLEIALPGSLFLLGAIDPFLRYAEVGGKFFPTYLNDLGKWLFHLVLLPIIVHKCLTILKTARNDFPGPRLFTRFDMAVGVFCFGFAVALTLGDVQTQMKDSVAWPEDFESISRDLQADRDVFIGNPNLTELEAGALKQKSISTLNSLHLDWRNIYEHWTARGAYAVFLSLFGTFLTSLFFCFIFKMKVPLQKEHARPGPHRILNTLILCISLFTLWVPATYHAQNYLRFTEFNLLKECTPIIFAILAIFMSLFFLYFIVSNLSWNYGVAVVVSTMTGLATGLELFDVKVLAMISNIMARSVLLYQICFATLPLFFAGGLFLLSNHTNQAVQALGIPLPSSQQSDP